MAKNRLTGFQSKLPSGQQSRKRLVKRVKGLTLAFLAAAVAMVVIYKTVLEKEYKPHKVFKSPNADYSLLILVENEAFNLSFNSNSDYRKAKAVLKDQNNKTVVESSLFLGCDFLLGDLNVQWDVANKFVHFSKFNSIDLQNLKMVCH